MASTTRRRVVCYEDQTGIIATGQYTGLLRIICIVIIIWVGRLSASGSTVDTEVVWALDSARQDRTSLYRFSIPSVPTVCYSISKFGICIWTRVQLTLYPHDIQSQHGRVDRTVQVGLRADYHSAEKCTASLDLNKILSSKCRLAYCGILLYDRVYRDLGNVRDVDDFRPHAVLLWQAASSRLLRLMIEWHLKALERIIQY